MVSDMVRATVSGVVRGIGGKGAGWPQARPWRMAMSAMSATRATRGGVTQGCGLGMAIAA